MKRNPMLVVLLLLMSSLLSTMTSAQLSNNDMQDLFSDEPQFLPVDDAFQFDFTQTGDKLVVQFDIADGYYLYKKQFKVVILIGVLADRASSLPSQLGNAQGRGARKSRKGKKQKKR